MCAHEQNSRRERAKIVCCLGEQRAIRPHRQFSLERKFSSSRLIDVDRSGLAVFRLGASRLGSGGLVRVSAASGRLVGATGIVRATGPVGYRSPRRSLEFKPSRTRSSRTRSDSSPLLPSPGRTPDPRLVLPPPAPAPRPHPRLSSALLPLPRPQLQLDRRRRWPPPRRGTAPRAQERRRRRRQLSLSPWATYARGVASYCGACVGGSKLHDGCRRAHARQWPLRLRARLHRLRAAS